MLFEADYAKNYDSILYQSLHTTECTLVLAISNHWFEMSGLSKVRSKKPLLQILLHENVEKNISQLFVSRQATLLLWQWSTPLDWDAGTFRIPVFFLGCLPSLLVQQRLDRTTKQPPRSCTLPFGWCFELDQRRAHSPLETEGRCAES